MAFLKVYSQGDERTVFLGDAPVVVGRGDDTDVLIKDIKASRRHCVIEPDGTGWRVRDLDSGNGTRLNGTAITSHALSPDDVVTIGDVRILFAGEAAAVVATPSPSAARPRRSSAQKTPRADAANGDGSNVSNGTNAATMSASARAEARRGRGNAKSSSTKLIGAVSLMLAGIILFVVTQSGKEDPRGSEADRYDALMKVEGDKERIRLSRTFLHDFPGSSYADSVEKALDGARERLKLAPAGYDPRREVEGLSPVESVARLEQLQQTAPVSRRSSIRRLLVEVKGKLDKERSSFFLTIRREFDQLVAKGEFARARELWFFLAGDPTWSPMPHAYRDKVIEANMLLENAASSARSDLFEEASRLEAAHDFAGAIAMLRKEHSRFKGTSVERSLRERIQLYKRARRDGVEGKPVRPRTVVRVNTEREMKTHLARLAQRDYATAVTKMRTLLEGARSRKERGLNEIEARLRECEAALATHEATTALLAAGKRPSRAVAKKWVVLSGGPDGVVVRIKGKEQAYTWQEVPAPLYHALAAQTTAAQGHLGLAVLSHSWGYQVGLMSALAAGYERPNEREALDTFVAARMRSEPVPKGGYVVDGREILTRREFIRREEQRKIKEFELRLATAFEKIENHKVFSKLSKVHKRKEAVDKARQYALKLIFDEKRYFYPYRGSGRMGEYTKVQRDVDARVAAVRELWDQPSLTKIGEPRDLMKQIAEFELVAAELRKRLVRIGERANRVRLLKSYLGKKFTVRTYFRSPSEAELLRYSVEVMEDNKVAQGDITAVEREQVRVTNEYRMMFGRWPTRIIDKLVLSSRGHCKEMAELGYFGHYSPTPGRRTPYDRMRLAGYDAGRSENCTMGPTTAQAAHDSWCGSSGHHRNLLMAAWTEMGTGHWGRLMTQNFGGPPRHTRADPVDEDEDAEDLDGGSVDDDDSGGWWEPDEDDESDEDGCGCGEDDGAKKDDDYEYGDEDE